MENELRGFVSHMETRSLPERAIRRLASSGKISVSHTKPFVQVRGELQFFPFCVFTFFDKISSSLIYLMEKGHLIALTYTLMFCRRDTHHSHLRMVIESHRAVWVGII